MKVIRCAALAAVLAPFGVSAAAPAAEPIPVEAFAKKPEFTHLKLSPDGNYVAALSPSDQGSGLLVMRLADRKVVGGFRPSDDNAVAGFSWVKNDRIVASLASQFGALDTPQWTGELVAFDADGSHQKYLFGYRGEDSRLGSRLNRVTKAYAGAVLVDPLLDDPNEVLISVFTGSTHSNTFQNLSRLNVYTAERHEVLTAPLGGGAEYLTDGKGEARYAQVGTGGLSRKVFVRTAEGGWAPLQPPANARTVEPLQMAKDGASVYLKSDEFGERECLVQQILATGERRRLACDDNADLAGVISGFGYRADPVAAEFAAAQPIAKPLPGAGSDAELLKMLTTAFAGKVVQPVSATRDGRLVLVRTYDDRTPGDYYLFEPATKKADYFLGEQTWLDPDLMAERRPIALKARDGTPLWGYLSLPRGVDPKKLPLVVHPHGGPFGIRDEWAFDNDAQLLASRGYAVLQVNFRGSGGYGQRFIEAGRKGWGTVMIDDITDATRWVVGQGYADPSRICIYGANYGGYAALMSAVREPDLYRCAIGYAGIYDLVSFKRQVDFTDFPSGLHYFNDAIASSDEEMQKQSPLSYIDRLKANVMIVHGEEDRRAPYAQAKELRDALTERKIPFEWLTRAGEGHGFRKTENVIALDKAVLGFLDKNIGAGATAK